MASHSRDTNTGAGQDFTGLAAAVQLRLRVASGLQALQRSNGLLSRGARGGTVATHHFNAPVAQCIERRASNAEVAGEIPAGSASLCRVSPTTRGAPLRTERLWVELPHAAPAFALRASARQANRIFEAASARRSAKRVGGSRSPTQRREAQTFDSAGASPATGTILECQPDERAGPRC